MILNQRPIQIDKLIWIIRSVRFGFGLVIYIIGADQLHIIEDSKIQENELSMKLTNLELDMSSKRLLIPSMSKLPASKLNSIIQETGVTVN